jgi:hypothetical protein
MNRLRSYSASRAEFPEVEIDRERKAGTSHYGRVFEVMRDICVLPSRPGARPDG